MLSKSAMDLAFPTAQALADRKVVLTGPGDDPITELAKVSLADIPSLLEQNPDATVTDLMGAIDSASRRQDESLGGINGCQHDRMMDELKNTVVQTVKKTIDIVRNTAIPLINDCAAAAKARLNEKAQAELYPFTVITYVAPAMCTDPVLSDMIENYRSQPLNDVQFIALPVETDGGDNVADRLFNAAATGIERYDNHIRDWLINNADRAATLYDAFGRSTNSLLNVVDMSSHRAIENATFVFLLARKLFAEGPPANVDMPLQAWRAYISGVVANAGAAIGSIQARAQREVTGRRLVLQSPHEGSHSGTYILNGNLVEQWCNDGGDIESIFGAHTGNRDFSYDGMIANKATNVAEWQRQHEVYTKVSASNLDTQSRLAVYDAIQPRLAALYPDQLSTARLYDQCQQLSANDTVDLYKAVRDVICATVFADTDVKRMIELFDQAALENPEADNRTVALIATTRYVGRWIGSLIKTHAVA